MPRGGFTLNDSFTLYHRAQYAYNRAQSAGNRVTFIHAENIARCNNSDLPRGAKSQTHERRLCYCFHFVF